MSRPIKGCFVRAWPGLMETPTLFSRSMVQRYAAAVVAVSLAALLRWLLHPYLGLDRFVPPAFLVAVLFATWYGLGPSLVAWMLSLVLSAYFFYSPQYSLMIEHPTNVWGFFLNGVVGLMIVLSAELWRRVVDTRKLRAIQQRLAGELAERQRAEAARQRTMERVKLLSDVASELLASERPQDVIQSLCERVIRHLDCQVAVNYLFDAERQRLHLNTSVGLAPETTRRLEWLNLGENGCGWVAQHGQRLILDNIPLSSDPRVGLLHALGAKAYVCLPLVNQGQMIGTLSFISQTKTSFSQDEVALMQAVSDHVAIAFQRMQLLESVRQRAAEAEEGRQILEALMDHLPLGLEVIDVPRGTVRFVSRYGAAQGGLTRAEVEGAQAEEINRRWIVLESDGATPPIWEEAMIARTRQSGEVFTEVELTLIKKDGQRMPILLSAAPVRNAQGQIVLTVVGWQDITQRKEAENALRAAHEQLEQKVAHRTAELAHAKAELELRAGQLQAMAMELTQSEERERRRLAQVLHDHLQQLLVAARMKMVLMRRRLRDERQGQTISEIDELLDQCITESRSLTVELSPPVLYDAGLGAAMAWLARQTEEKHELEVRGTVAADTEPAELGTRILLFQAARELLFNVVKHAQASLAEIKLTRTDGQIRLEVGDNGIGFDAEQLNHHAGSRSGFGLLSIRERLELIGGRFEMDSAVGRGSRMVLYAPVEPRHPPGEAAVAKLPRMVREAVAAAPQPPVEGQVIRVLLADDHPILRKGLADVLGEQPGIELVGEAGDGEEVIKLAREIRPDVVLMDVTMPKLSGIEATRQIVAEQPGVRVIGLSMHEQSDMATAMRKAGAVAYLSKSQPTEALVAMILHPSITTEDA